ncbi:MAG: DUF3016 domain-containing protein [Opitutales bacterium]|jgi:hypothetical protein
MKKTLLALSVLLLPLAVQAAVSVEWVSPENFRDAYSSSVKSDKSRQVILDDLQKFIEAQASAKLTEGQNLKIRVTDVDLAGEFEPWSQNSNVRMIRDTYFARIVFDYELSDASGAIVKQGNVKLVNDLLSKPGMPDKDELTPYLRDSLRVWFNANL